MDQVDESFERYANVHNFHEDEPTSKLKQGLLLRDLLDKKEAEFEVCMPDVDLTDETCYSDEEAADYINPVMLEANDDCEDDGRSLYERYAEKMVDISGDRGVMKKLVTEGTGKNVLAGAVVVFHYRSYLETSHEPFDSSRLRNCPTTVKLGIGALQVGLEMALQTMREREVCQVLLAPAYAYGKMGCPPRIPANSTIFYELELLEMMDSEAALKFDSLTSEEKSEFQFERKMAATEAEKKAGTRYFNQGQLYKALNKYKKAIYIQEQCKMRNQEDQDASDKILLALYVNAAIVYAKLEKDPVKVMVNCNKALELDRNNVKALYWKGQAKVDKGDYFDGQRLLQQALRLKPKSPEIELALQQLKERKAKSDQADRLKYSALFKSSPGNATPDHVVVQELASEVEELHLGVSDDFKRMTLRTLQDFLTEHNRYEMSFPSALSFQELEYLENQCVERNIQLSKSENGIGEVELTITKLDN